MSMYNPRFPHRIVISRAQVDIYGTPVTDDNGDPLDEIVLNEKCGLRNITEADINSGIAQTDVKVCLELPTTIQIWKVEVTDKVSFTNTQTGDTIIGNVTKYRPNNLGIDLFFHVNG